MQAHLHAFVDHHPLLVRRDIRHGQHQRVHVVFLDALGREAFLHRQDRDTVHHLAGLGEIIVHEVRDLETHRVITRQDVLRHATQRARTIDHDHPPLPATMLFAYEVDKLNEQTDQHDEEGHHGNRENHLYHSRYIIQELWREGSQRPPGNPVQSEAQEAGANNTENIVEPSVPNQSDIRADNEERDKEKRKDEKNIIETMLHRQRPVPYQ